MQLIIKQKIKLCFIVENLSYSTGLIVLPVSVVVSMEIIWRLF